MEGVVGCSGLAQDPAPLVPRALRLRDALHALRGPAGARRDRLRRQPQHLVGRAARSHRHGSDQRLLQEDGPLLRRRPVRHRPEADRPLVQPEGLLRGQGHRRRRGARREGPRAPGGPHRGGSPRVREGHLVRRHRRRESGRDGGHRRRAGAAPRGQFRRGPVREVQGAARRSAQAPRIRRSAGERPGARGARGRDRVHHLQARAGTQIHVRPGGGPATAPSTPPRSSARPGYAAATRSRPARCSSRSSGSTTWARSPASGLRSSRWGTARSRRCG